MSSAEKVIRRLYSITANYAEGFPAQLKDMLELGCERFKLDVGIVARIEGDRYHVVQSAGQPDRPGPGDEFSLSHTYCSLTLDADGPVGFHHASATEFERHPCYQKHGLEAYIGMPIRNRNSTWGTINFSSLTHKTAPFTEVDTDAIRLMATWVSGEIERQSLEEHMTKLHGLIPICSSCKSIRSDLGDWEALEDYLTNSAHLELTHGVCPHCAARLRESFHDYIREGQN